MNRLSELPETANRAFAGLKADQSLKFRILQASAKGSSGDTARAFSRLHLFPALCVIALLLLLSLSVMQALSGAGISVPEIDTFAAGEHKASSPVSLSEILIEADTPD